MSVETLSAYADLTNIAEKLDEKTLDEIGTSLVTSIKSDDDSRLEWLKDYDRWLLLAEQVMETKSTPWVGASNVKFPALSIAAIQFHARIFPALFGSRSIIKGKVFGRKTPEKLARADRVGRFMSCQLIDLMDDWQEEMDRALFILAIAGLIYKKTYQSELRNGPRSEVVLAKDLIVNYHANGYDRVRMSHRIFQDGNEIREMVNAKLYLDVDLGSPIVTQRDEAGDKAQGKTPPGDIDSFTPYEIYESHCWWDLDGDEYEEPYIITVAAASGKVLRIVARYSKEDIMGNGDVVLRITPEQYFTAYKFLPDPNSKTHALGFGRLLGPTNAAINSIMNLLIDSGVMASFGGGFLSRGVRVTGGTVAFKPMEWKHTQSSGEDLHKGIFPLPRQEPSAVLFQLLGLLINASKDLSTVQDNLVGRNPGQNQPYITTEKIIEQGMQVFNGIYKRVYRSLTQEAKKVYKLNYEYLPGAFYGDVLDEEEGTPDPREDFAPDGFDVLPSAEPDMIEEINRIQKANMLLAKLSAGMPLNPTVVTRVVLEAEGHENIEELMTLPEPQPSIEQQQLQLEAEKFKHQRQKDMAELNLEKLRAEDQILKDRVMSIVALRKVSLEEDKVDLETERAAVNVINEQRAHVLKQMEIELAKMNKPENGSGETENDAN